MLRNPRFVFLCMFLLACAAMLAWAVEPILDSDGEAIGEVTVPDPSNWAHRIEPLFGLPPEGGGVLLANPLITKFFPATFQPTGDTNLNWRYGALLVRGNNNTAGFVVLVIVNVIPDNPRILDFGPVLGIRTDTNHFFKGKAEAVLAVSSLDPSGNNNGSFALVISDKSDGQVAGTEPGFGTIVIARNAWGDLTAGDPGNPGQFLHLDTIPGLTGPVSAAIDDTAQEVVVVEQTTTTAGACAVGQSPLRFFRLADGTEARPTICIDGVGDSADVEIDRGFGRNQAFIARSFSKGNISVIDLNNFTESLPSPALYPPGDPAPAPGLDLDLAALGGGRGYLAAPELAGVLPFNLTTFASEALIEADVYYHLRNGIATGVQEVSVANSNNANTVRRGIVISRADPVNFPNRADQVTRVNLITRNNNRLGTSYQTTAVAFVPQRSTDQSNQQFFLRILVLSTDAVRLKLKKYDSGTVP